MLDLPALSIECAAIRVNDECAVEIIGELLERLGEGEDRTEVNLYSDLRATSRWCGVGDIDRNVAQTVGLILAANRSLVAEIRSAHIPLILLGFG